MGFANVLDQGTKKRGRERCGESKNRVKKSGMDRLWRKTEGNDLGEEGKRERGDLAGEKLQKKTGSEGGERSFLRKS